MGDSCCVTIICRAADRAVIESDDEGWGRCSRESPVEGSEGQVVRLEFEVNYAENDMRDGWAKRGLVFCGCYDPSAYYDGGEFYAVNGMDLEAPQSTHGSIMATLDQDTLTIGVGEQRWLERFRSHRAACLAILGMDYTWRWVGPNCDKGCG